MPACAKHAAACTCTVCSGPVAYRLFVMPWISALHIIACMTPMIQSMVSGSTLPVCDALAFSSANHCMHEPCDLINGDPINGDLINGDLINGDMIVSSSLFQPCAAHYCEPQVVHKLIAQLIL